MNIKYAAEEASKVCETVVNSKTGLGNLKWFPLSVALTVSCS